MNRILMFFGMVGILSNANAQKNKPTVKIEKIVVEYKGKKVNAKKLIVISEIPMDIDNACAEVKTSQLLQFVAKGKVKFKPTGGHFPETWKQGDTVTTKMLVYGIVPFGGLHSLSFELIDNTNYILQTREWDSVAKIWNHKISWKKLNENTIIYEDEVIIYWRFSNRFYYKLGKIILQAQAKKVANSC